MPIEIKMPALSPTMEEGTLAKWLVKEGDTVKSGDILAEIETDKATMEFETIDEGTVQKILVPEGTDGVKVGAAILVLAGEDEDASAPAPKADATPAAKPARPYRLHGTVLSIGALMWAAAIALYGADPSDSAVGAMVFGIGSGAFQIGLLFLLRVLRRTDALGTGKGARRVLVVENVFVGLAIASTIADAVRISDLSQPGWLLLDAFWPISMIGMFGLAIRIAIAGRWKGVSRFWPLVAESWAIVVLRPEIGGRSRTADRSGEPVAVLALLLP